MKNLIVASVLLLSATSFAQLGNIPAVNSGTAQANGAAAQANGATTQANSKMNDTKVAGNAQIGKGKQALQSLQVNVNTASKDDLAKLPGIGPKKADAIIANRPYTSADGLTKVKGIGSATVNKIKDKITF